MVLLGLAEEEVVVVVAVAMVVFFFLPLFVFLSQPFCQSALRPHVSLRTNVTFVSRPPF
jgi:hypothetical protein